MPVLAKHDTFRDASNPYQHSWTVLRKLGEGQSAEVFAVRSDQAPSIQHAVKIEREAGAKALRGELKVLKALQGSQHACQLIEHGTYNDHEYIVMELLGQNAVELRKAQAPAGRWGTRTVKQLGMAMLAGLHEMHALGYIHRDVKPANFAVSPPGYSCCAGDDFEGDLKVIDFGLSKKYIDDAGSVVAQRDGKAGFRGSTAYASLYAHEEQELGRRDDLWSWLYVIVEMLDGGLCWRMDRDKQQGEDKQRKKELALVKKQAAFQNPALLTAQVELPDGLTHISNYLATLSFADLPDYALLEHHLQSIPDMHPRLKQSHPSSYPGDSIGHMPEPAGNGHLPPPSTRYPEAHASVSGMQAEAPWQPQGYSNGYAPSYAQPNVYTQHPQGEQGMDGMWDHTQHNYQPHQHLQHQHQHLHSQAPYATSYPSPLPPIADTPMSPYEERATSSSFAGIPSEPLTGPSPYSPHSMPGSPPPAGHATNGIDLDELKRKAQLHMQMNLARNSADSKPPVSEVNGRHRGVKREASLDGGARDSHQNAKRSRLAVSATEEAKLHSHHDSRQEKLPQQQPVDGLPEDDSFQTIAQMVQQVQANRISRSARDAKDCLRNLDAAEGIGVIAWLVDGMLTQRTDEKSKALIKDWVQDLGSFINHRTQ